MYQKQYLYLAVGILCVILLCAGGWYLYSRSARPPSAVRLFTREASEFPWHGYNTIETVQKHWREITWSDKVPLSVKYDWAFEDRDAGVDLQIGYVSGVEGIVKNLSRPSGTYDRATDTYTLMMHCESPPISQRNTWLGADRHPYARVLQLSGTNGYNVPVYMGRGPAEGASQFPLIGAVLRFRFPVIKRDDGSKWVDLSRPSLVPDDENNLIVDVDDARRQSMGDYDDCANFSPATRLPALQRAVWSVIEHVLATVLFLPLAELMREKLGFPGPRIA